MCKVGRTCIPNTDSCCDGSNVLQCIGGVYGDPGPANSACFNDTTQLVCINGDVDAVNCPAGHVCVSDQNECYMKPPGVDDCVVGDLTCSGQSVQRCERRPEADYNARWYFALSCSSDNMICDPPGFATTNPLQYCVNECGGRGIILDHAVCDAAEAGEPPCAVYVCYGTNALQLDHENCLGGGQSCTQNQECASCNCSNGSCQGNIPAHCPIAQQCP